MTINEGLFKLDVIDHHAILGFSLAAESKQVRKRYLKVARKLHPDSLRSASEENKQKASELLSKMVNPAYEHLSQEKKAKEHEILLKMKQQQLVARPILLSAKSEEAKKLLATSNLEHEYSAALQKVAQTQFDDLSRVDDAIALISELNAVYLMRKGNVGSQPARTASSSGGKKAKDAVPATPRRSQHDVIIESYLGRAKEFEYKKDYSRAILELREAIATHPKSAPCHARLSSLYLKSGQATLAKIHAKRALAFDAENEEAKKVQAQLRSAGSKADKSRAAKGAAKSSSKKSSGLLSGLFGGKK